MSEPMENQEEEPVTHTCLDDEPSTEFAWWVNDAQGIPLCKVCNKCEAKKLSRYRPEILTGYTQADVDEPIEPEESCYGDEDW